MGSWSTMLAGTGFGPGSHVPPPEILAGALVLLLVLLIFGTRRA